ncbi:hypothetical protein PoB_005441400 [Plakobranchus ocellatus]|uniref:Uncharacterized protein n=1 Tax=Plakobranchus ocellatus TaxID=259542 RepID=A0AAV4CA29_9GAST|nr:hypothetical protein PoB_005441400 [Plakobranchus ocellatus]
MALDMCPSCYPANIKATVEPVMERKKKGPCTVLSVIAQNTFTLRELRSTQEWYEDYEIYILTLCLITFPFRWKVASSLKIIFDSRSGSFSIDSSTM